MEVVNQQRLTGERALFKAKDVDIRNTVFEDGESPLKESHNIKVSNSIFRWKYPIWYSTDIKAEGVTLTNTARSGIWYTHNLVMRNSVIEAPKTFRRASNITLENVTMPYAEETFWNCQKISLNKVQATGDYFALDSTGITVTDFTLTGNYGFDGCKDVHIKNANIISKDAFWNCENVVVENSTIIGEYFGWNAKNMTLINCTIESEQGLCYIENLKMIDCELLNTTLAFEYTTVDATILSTIESVKNPYSGVIRSYGIGELIQDDPAVDHTATEYIRIEEQ